VQKYCSMVSAWQNSIVMRSATELAGLGVRDSRLNALRCLVQALATFGMGAHSCLGAPLYMQVKLMFCPVQASTP